MKIVKKVSCAEDYPSASLMLEISKAEYERERERSNMLDNKASFFLSATIAVLTIFIPIIPFSKLVGFFNSATKVYMSLVIIAICLLFTALVFFLISAKNLYSAYNVQKFKNINYENLDDDGILQTKKNQTERGLIKHYNDILVYNATVNNEKANKIRTGLKYSVLSFSFIFISTILLIILIGG